MLSMKLKFEGTAARMASSSLATDLYTVCGYILEILAARLSDLASMAFRLWSVLVAKLNIIDFNKTYLQPTIYQVATLRGRRKKIHGFGKIICE